MLFKKIPFFYSQQASKFGFKSIGPKEAEANVRQFTDEQLKAGQGVISLQYGSNKGANQSGINFGNTRHMWIMQCVKELPFVYFCAVFSVYISTEENEFFSTLRNSQLFLKNEI